MITADRAAPPPQAQVMQMMTAAWLSQTIAAVTRLGVPDLVGRHGPLSARQLAEQHGVEARPEFLERALRACASAGIFTEAPDGRFGPNSAAAVKELQRLYGLPVDGVVYEDVYYVLGLK